MITKNFRLNALANKYASALYNHITSTSGGDYFMVDADGEAVRVEIVNGVIGRLICYGKLVAQSSRNSLMELLITKVWRE
ncbi:hypothetical protein OMX29_004588 [Escherichia coli]|nr:hypothetical protein [Escherichia coli]